MRAYGFTVSAIVFEMSGEPGPLVLKYTRSRSTVPATMIKELVSEFRTSYSPKFVRKDDDVDDREDQDPCWSS